jgi:hypothetical protein
MEATHINTGAVLDSGSIPAASTNKTLKIKDLENISTLK